MRLLGLWRGGEREFDGGKAQGKGKGGLTGGWREE